jgi:transcriptional regulator with XRE-family HTH domain
MTKKNIGKRIILKREELDLSQEDLASLCQVKAQNIQEWENGVNLPEGTTLFSLSQALRTNADFLFYGDDDLPSPRIMGVNLIVTLIILAFSTSTIILLSGLSSLATKAPISTGFTIIALSVSVFCILYWMAAILSSVIATRSTNEKILQELIKLNNQDK